MCKNDSIEKKCEILKNLEKECDKCISMYIDCGLYTPCTKCEIYMEIVRLRKQCGVEI